MKQKRYLFIWITVVIFTLCGCFSDSKQEKELQMATESNEKSDERVEHIKFIDGEMRIDDKKVLTLKKSGAFAFPCETATFHMIDVDEDGLKEILLSGNSGNGHFEVLRVIDMVKEEGKTTYKEIPYPAWITDDGTMITTKSNCVFENDFKITLSCENGFEKKEKIKAGDLSSAKEYLYNKNVCTQPETKVGYGSMKYDEKKKLFVLQEEFDSKEYPIVEATKLTTYLTLEKGEFVCVKQE